MLSDDMRAQAEEVLWLFSKVMRTIYALDPDDPATGLPVAQLRLCTVLLDEPRSISCLSKELGISVSAVTQLADRLEKAGLVERFNDVSDRRVKRLRLTYEGELIMKPRWEKRVERLTGILENLSEKDRLFVKATFKVLLETGQEAGIT